MIKRLIIVLAALIVVFGGVFGWKWYVTQQIAKARASAPPPVAVVQARKAEAKTWHPTLSATGSLQAIQGVDLSTEVSGVVTEIHFKSGQAVKKGDVLVALDTAADEAELRSLQAQSQLTQIQYHRQLKLYQGHNTSDANLNTAEAQNKQAKAQVSKQQATIAKKIIRAPFDGILGIRKVDLGQYLAPGTAIVTLQQLDRIYVNFSLPQQNLPKVHDGQKVRITAQGFGNDTFEGKITAISPEVNADTRNFAVQATINNRNHALRPGMFVDAAVELPSQQKMITVPQTAISYNPYGDFVYILDKTGKQRNGKPLYKAKRHLVDTGETRGDFVQIDKGIKAGNLVVTAGALKLHPGGLAQINDKNEPSFSSNPTVSEQ